MEILTLFFLSMVSVRFRVGNGEAFWCRGIGIGLVVGCAIGAFLELTHGRTSVLDRPKLLEPSSQVPAAQPKPPEEAQQPGAIVAVCVGGWLELTYPRRAQSVADNVFAVMPSEAFVAGTVRGGNLTEERTTAALDGISALKPYFARTSVILMPTPADLRRELQASGHFRDYEVPAPHGPSHVASSAQAPCDCRSKRPRVAPAASTLPAPTRPTPPRGCPS